MSSGGTYDPQAIEGRIYEMWERGAGGVSYFHAEPDPARPAYSIVIPPPNVTGALHLGHALNNTLQDILIRVHRMRGYATCWLPGTDHAGIATQAVVEKRLREEQGWKRDPHNPEHRKFLVDKIWEWKEEYNARILSQLRRMGCSCDWARTRFTLDEQCAKAVYETFFRFFRDGLIYRGLRLVNWDTQLQTAVADDEVYHETVKGHLWHIRYPLLGSGVGKWESGKVGREKTSASGHLPTFPPSHLPTGDEVAEAIRRATAPDAELGVDYLVVATTRPETMLADTAVAVHPEDERYQHLIGKHVLLPLMWRPIPVVADGMLVKREFGTGCVKVTPGHDPNDYACYQRKLGQPDEIGIIDLLTPDGRINENGDSSVGPPWPTEKARNAGERPTPSAAEDTSATEGRRYGGGMNASAAEDTSATEGRRYGGMKKDDARKQVVADLEALGLLEKVEPYETDIGHSDRSKTPIEPLRSEQWFVKMGDLPPEQAAKIPALRGAAGLADLALRQVCDQAHANEAERRRCGRIHFFPSRYAKTYLDWLGEKRDWCISRQLWWGHRIPVWIYRGAGRTRPLDDTPQSGFQGVWNNLAQLMKKHPDRIFARHATRGTESGTGTGFIELHACLRNPADPLRKELAQLGMSEDPDVLDTWFSSQLWTHSTFGWPEADANLKSEISDLKYFYPTSVLSTAREIITLWVARMVMAGMYNMAEIPFRHVYIHAVIQDGHGRRMSKSAGNGVDPVDIIDMYGADALRFTLAQLATETQDIRIPVKPAKLPDGRTVNTSEKFELGRNFCNKLWQAATGYVIPAVRDVKIERRPRRADATDVAGGSSAYHTSKPPGELPLFDRWIRTRLSHTIAAANEHLANYRFAAYVDEVRSFFWSEFCDWYIEESKVRLATGTPDEINDVKIVLLQVLDLSLALLHPVMPYVTEEIWQRIGAEIPRHHELIWPDSESPSGAGSGTGSGAGSGTGVPPVIGTQKGIATAPVIGTQTGIGNPPVVGTPAGRTGVSPAPPPTTTTGSTDDTGGTPVPHKAPLLIVAPWPERWQHAEDDLCEREIGDLLQPIIRALREVRTQVNANRAETRQPAIRTLPRAAIRLDAAGAERLRLHEPTLLRLGQCDALEIGPDVAKPPESAAKVLPGIEVYVPLAGLADLEVWRGRLRKDRDDKRAYVRRLEQKLANESYVSRAPAEVVQGERERLAEAREQLAGIERNLAEIGG